jgi:hypothetical protein
MKLGDNYVIWDGINEEPFAEDKMGNPCLITSDLKLLPISEMLAIAHKKSLVPIIVFSCKKGQTSIEKNFGGEGHGAFTYFFCTLLKRDPNVTIRDAISLVNIDLHQEGLEQRAEVICRIDILDTPILNTSVPDEKTLTIILDMCRTEQTIAELRDSFKE